MLSFGGFDDCGAVDSGVEDSRRASLALEEGFFEVAVKFSRV